MLFPKSLNTIFAAVFLLTACAPFAAPQSPQPPLSETTTSPDVPKDLDGVEHEGRPADPKNFAEVVDRTIASEHILISKLKSKQPVVETYIQEMKSDSDLGVVPERDYYFLAKLDLSHGFIRESFLPSLSALKRIPHFFSELINTDYYPLGFAYEIFVDSSNFDRAHYYFSYVKREFLGSVRCIVINVIPLKGSGKGRFVGRIWVEDRDYNIVRINGTYIPSSTHDFAHFDSWRVNAGPNLWLPAYIYAQEEAYSFAFLKTPSMRAQTRLWNYEPQRDRSEEAFTNLTVDIPQGVRDNSEAAADNSPAQSERMWETQAEANLVDRLEQAGLVAPRGDVDQVLDTVLNNLEVTNNVNIDPPVHVRVLLTSPFESIAVNHTILVSRGLIDVLPDEASLAAILAHELSHILLGHSINTKYAFADRLLFDDPSTLRRVSIARTQKEEEDADQKAIEILKNSPYADKLPRVGLFLRMLSRQSNEMPHLIRPLLGNRLAKNGKDLRLSGLMDLSPQLQLRDPEQIAALPLGSRVKVDPWSDQLRMMKTQNVKLLSAREKMPFQVTPFILNLTREPSDPPAATTASQ